MYRYLPQVGYGEAQGRLREGGEVCGALSTDMSAWSLVLGRVAAVIRVKLYRVHGRGTTGQAGSVCCSYWLQDGWT